MINQNKLRTMNMKYLVRLPGHRGSEKNNLDY